MGLPDGRKRFKIGLVVLIQYWLWQTASQPATQPDRHVAVAKTRYAIASCLKFPFTCTHTTQHTAIRCGVVLDVRESTVSDLGTTPYAGTSDTHRASV